MSIFSNSLELEVSPEAKGEFIYAALSRIRTAGLLVAGWRQIPHD